MFYHLKIVFWSWPNHSFWTKWLCVPSICARKSWFDWFDQKQTDPCAYHSRARFETQKTDYRTPLVSSGCTGFYGFCSCFLGWGGVFTVTRIPLSMHRPWWSAGLLHRGPLQPRVALLGGCARQPGALGLVHLKDVFIIWGVRVIVDPPPPKKQQKNEIHQKPVQSDDQNIWSNFRLLLNKSIFCLNIRKSKFFTTTKPRDHSKSIGRQILLLTRGLKPHIDLLQGPNMII